MSLVVVAGMVGVSGFGSGELLSSSGLRLRVQVFNLSLTEDAVEYG